MNERQFQGILRAKESARIDFKIDCSAFVAKEIRPRAELARDICAMANNGNVTSYLIIGVSDDGKHFRSVANPKLTDDRVQRFCLSAVNPPPRVRLFRRTWASTRRRYAGVEFVFIQVGPQARRAFSLARDFVDYRREVCYRRNEVWVRRGATTDLATAEEVARLIAAQSFSADDEPADNVVYQRLSRDAKRSELIDDMAKAAAEIGGRMVTGGMPDRGPHLLLPISRGSLVLKIVIGDHFSRTWSVWERVGREWTYEHGLLVLSFGPVSRLALPPVAQVKSKERWGWLTTMAIPLDLRSTHQPPRITIPGNTSRSDLIIFTLPALRDTRDVARRLRLLNAQLSEEPVVRDMVLSAYRATNANLKQWLAQGWLFTKNGWWWASHERKAGAGSLVDERLYKGEVRVRLRDPELESAAKLVLDLARGSPVAPGKSRG